MTKPCALIRATRRPFWHTGVGSGANQRTGRRKPATCRRASALWQVTATSPKSLPKTPSNHLVPHRSCTLAGWETSSVTQGPPPEQKAHLQTDALKKAGRTRVGTEKASGSSTTAPSWKRSSITSAPPVPSWRLDRLGDQTKSSPSWLSSSHPPHTSEGSQYRPDPHCPTRRRPVPLASEHVPDRCLRPAR